jgi:hypothetical protein
MKYLSTSLQGHPSYFNFEYENALRLEIAVIRFISVIWAITILGGTCGAVIDLHWFARHRFYFDYGARHLVTATFVQHL